MTVVTHEQLEAYREETTRQIALADGAVWPVRMSHDHWDAVEFLEMVEGIRVGELTNFALEEMVLQDIDFSEAFRCVVAHLINRWSLKSH
jgi:hypothetical protein